MADPTNEVNGSPDELAKGDATASAKQRRDQARQERAKESARQLQELEKSAAAAKQAFSDAAHQDDLAQNDEAKAAGEARRRQREQTRQRKDRGAAPRRTREGRHQQGARGGSPQPQGQEAYRRDVAQREANRDIGQPRAGADAERARRSRANTQAPMAATRHEVAAGTPKGQDAAEARQAEREAKGPRRAGQQAAQGGGMRLGPVGEEAAEARRAEAARRRAQRGPQGGQQDGQGAPPGGQPGQQGGAHELEAAYGAIKGRFGRQGLEAIRAFKARNKTNKERLRAIRELKRQNGSQWPAGLMGEYGPVGTGAGPAGGAGGRQREQGAVVPGPAGAAAGTGAGPLAEAAVMTPEEREEQEFEDALDELATATSWEDLTPEAQQLALANPRLMNADLRKNLPDRIRREIRDNERRNGTPHDDGRAGVVVGPVDDGMHPSQPLPHEPEPLAEPPADDQWDDQGMLPAPDPNAGMPADDGRGDLSRRGALTDGEGGPGGLSRNARGSLGDGRGDLEDEAAQQQQAEAERKRDERRKKVTKRVVGFVISHLPLILMILGLMTVFGGVMKLLGWADMFGL